MAAPIPAHIRDKTRQRRLARLVERAEMRAEETDGRARDLLTFCASLARRVTELEAEVAALKAAAPPPTTPRR